MIKDMDEFKSGVNLLTQQYDNTYMRYCRTKKKSPLGDNQVGFYHYVQNGFRFQIKEMIKQIQRDVRIEGEIIEKLTITANKLEGSHKQMRFKNVKEKKKVYTGIKRQAKTTIQYLRRLL